MVPVSLQLDQTIKQQGEEISLLKNSAFVSSKTNQSSDRWYYEATHLGGNIYNLFGFKTNSGGINFYPLGDIDNPQIYTTGSFRNKMGFIEIPFTIAHVHTVGNGIDFEKSLFFVYYNTNFFVHEFPILQSNDGFNLLICGSSSDRSNETVTVIFGDFPFKYHIIGYTAWSNNNNILSTR